MVRMEATRAETANFVRGEDIDVVGSAVVVGSGVVGGSA